MGFLLLKNIAELLTLEGAEQKDGRRIQERDLSLQKQASVLSQDGKIIWIGPHKKLPRAFAKKKVKEFDMKGKTVLPGFVECHTHTVFAGSRAHEFELRNQGVSYQEIAARGGGILSTMKQTRKMSSAALLKESQKRVDKFVRQGVTTLEIKSGYALDAAGEIKMLEVIRRLQKVRAVPTFLGAHDLPPEFKSHDEYLHYLSEKVLPLVKKKKLAKRVDIFIEKGFFSRESGENYLRQAQAMGFDVLVHADQLSLSGGAATAVRLKALSGDHLLQITEAEIHQLASSSVTCVLLPASDLYMKKNYPPARSLIDAGARVALATDFNPGSSPTQDLALTGLLARLEMKMSLPEVISAYTVGAASALKLISEVGSLRIGKSADFMCTSKSWTDLFYSAGDPGAELVFVSGNVSHQEI
jgi:imidazolonepropionase